MIKTIIKTTKHSAITLSVALFVASPLALAETTQEKGLAIATEIKSRDIGWGSSQSEMVMTLRTRKGQEIVRQMRSNSRAWLRRWLCKYLRGDKFVAALKRRLKLR